MPDCSPPCYRPRRLLIDQLIGLPASMESGNLFAFPQQGAAVALLVDGTSTPWIDR